MLKDREHKKIKVSARRNTVILDLQLLFHEDAAEAMVRFLDHTAVGRRKEEREVEAIDEWDIDRLDRSDETGGEVVGQGGG